VCGWDKHEKLFVSPHFFIQTCAISFFYFTGEQGMEKRLENVESMSKIDI